MHDYVSMLPKGTDKPLIYLSPSEKRIAQIYVKTSLKQQDIADKLFVCIKTIRFHVTNIFKKLNVKSRVELVQNYHQKGRVWDVLEAPDIDSIYASVPEPPEGLEWALASAQIT